MLVGLASALAGCSGDGGGAGGGTGGGDAAGSAPTGTGTGGETGGGKLHRLALTSMGAEITGLAFGPDDTLFMNVQHPVRENELPWARPGIGVFLRPLSGLPERFPSVQPPDGGLMRRVETEWGRYQVLAYGGDELPDGGRLGAVYTPGGDLVTAGGRPDCNAFIPESENEGYLYTNWETKPGMVSRLHISRDYPGGRWWVDDARNLDLGPVEGTWRNCFGSVSPWGTPLLAEELHYAATWQWNSEGRGAGVDRLAAHLGHFPNPYRYGWMLEVRDPTSSDPTVVKQTALGRYSHENALVMPDRRTVYLTDDEHATGFYKFVADEPGDLSAGTLYAAKAKQDPGRDPNEVGFALDWLELAHGTRSQVDRWVAEYDGITPVDYREGETSYLSVMDAKRWAEGAADDDRVAFLETRKAAAAAGATVEFNKMEGINARPGAGPGDSIYAAMSFVSGPMSDGEGDVNVRANPWGAVYRFEIQEGYDVRYMEPLITGGPWANVCGGCPYTASPGSSDVCEGCAYNPDNGGSQRLDTRHTIANPDNVVVASDGRVVIGEDTGKHGNSMVWVYDP